MVSLDEEEWILSHAYIPEHIVSLMRLISKGEPFLIEDHLVIVKNKLIIFIGYPLDQSFSVENCENILRRVIERFKAESIRFIGPEIPEFLLKASIERQSDKYYLLDLDQVKIKTSLLRLAQKMALEFSFEITNSYTKEHQALNSELFKRDLLTTRVKDLYKSMPDYVSHSKTTYILNVRNKQGKLSAYYILEVGAKKFNTYLLGVHSKRNYIPHASDFLFYKMIELTEKQGKKKIHLGLGVNEGIRRFKEKWGGIPFLNYEYCECYLGRDKPLSLIKEIEGRL